MAVSLWLTVNGISIFSSLRLSLREELDERWLSESHRLSAVCYAEGATANVLRPEALPILTRVHKAGNHPARVVGLIQHLDPNEISTVRLASQVAKIFHHRVGLMVVLRRHFRTLHDLS